MSSPAKPAARQVPPAAVPPVAPGVNPHSLRQEAVDTLSSAEQILDVARAYIQGFIATQIKQCDDTLQECRDYLRGQLDAAVKGAYDTYAGTYRDVRDNVAYLMSMAEQYAGLIGYRNPQTSVPEWAPKAEQVQRNIDYLHTGTGPTESPIMPGRQAVGPRSRTPEAQQQLDTQSRDMPNFLDVSVKPYNPNPVYPVNAGQPVVLPSQQQQPISAVPFSPVRQPGTVAIQQVPASPIAVSPVAASATSPVLTDVPEGNTPQSITGLAPITQSLTLPPNLPAITLPSGQVLRRLNTIGYPTSAGPTFSGPALGSQSNPWTYETAGGQFWPNVQPGQWFKMPDGELFLAVAVGSEPPAGYLSGPKLSDTIGGWKPSTPGGLTSLPPAVSPADSSQPNFCPDPSTPQAELTPWQAANCVNAGTVAPSVVTPDGVCCSGPSPIVQFDLTSLCSCITNALAELTLNPVDLDQPIAFRWAPDDLPWKAQALEWGGKGLKMYSASESLDSLNTVIRKAIPATTRINE